jgi:hypothetical protein
LFTNLTEAYSRTSLAVVNCTVNARARIHVKAIVHEALNTRARIQVVVISSITYGAGTGIRAFKTVVRTRQALISSRVNKEASSGGA